VKDLLAGHVITPEDVRRIRIGIELVLKYFDQVVDRCVTQTIKRGMSVHWDIIIESKAVAMNNVSYG